MLNSNGGYAFFMESTSIEYQVERNCDLSQIGGNLDSKSYGIALPQGKEKYTTKATVAFLAARKVPTQMEFLCSRLAVMTFRAHDTKNFFYYIALQKPMATLLKTAEN